VSTPVKTHAHPVEQEHITLVSAYDDNDYVTVVGCSNPAIFDTWSPKDWARNAIKGQPGEEAQFINQGIRQIRQYVFDKKGIDKKVFLIFREEYEEKALARVKKIITETYKADYMELDNISDLVDFVNQREAKTRFIKKLDIFSHGLVGSIEFGYHTDKADTYRLKAEQAKQLKPAMFDDDAIITSYACRTGVGVDREKFSEQMDKRYNKSLAQVLADNVDVTVHAYARRSNYDGTYGTAEERQTGIKTESKVEAYNAKREAYRAELNRYEKQSAAYAKKLADYRQSSGQANASSLPGEAPPVPPKEPVKDFSDKDETLARHTMSQKMNQKECGIPIDEHGAVRPVRAGDTPTGLPDVLLLFEPAGRKKK
jgi:hypothetical protein